MDLARGSVVVHTLAEADRAVELLTKKLGTGPRRNLLRGEKSFNGYRDVLFSTQVELPDGSMFPAEIQVHIPGMIDAKENRGGHLLYEKDRDLKALIEETRKRGGDVSELFAQRERIAAASKKLYEPIYSEALRVDATRASNASREISSPASVTMAALTMRGVPPDQSSAQPSDSSVAMGRPPTDQNLSSTVPTGKLNISSSPAARIPPAPAVAQTPTAPEV